VTILEKAPAAAAGGNSFFHGNYPGGTGLTAGAVFGRRAGTHAAGG
jgi:tricarballylate dehydrogenase